MFSLRMPKECSSCAWWNRMGCIFWPLCGGVCGLLTELNFLNPALETLMHRFCFDSPGKTEMSIEVATRRL
uniref:Uncharacterized protein n=1 Tax=Physcomitrium patens TaxID=3218 RepID=A0A2K1IHK3_PHYPA|nr:hypothetical protein PHYPA_029333 [Physcomitrium patens]